MMNKCERRLMGNKLFTIIMNVVANRVISIGRDYCTSPSLSLPLSLSLCCCIERPLEDHECVVDVYTHWARDTNNQFLFKLMEDKYEIFEDPTVSHLL